MSYKRRSTKSQSAVCIRIISGVVINSSFKNEGQQTYDCPKKRCRLASPQCPYCYTNIRTRTVLLRMMILKENRLVRANVSSGDTQVGTEEIAHWEMIATMITQCMQGASLEELSAAGLDGYYTMHSYGVFPADPNGVPFTTAYIACTGDPIADLVEDMAADAATSDSLPTLKKSLNH